MISQSSVAELDALKVVQLFKLRVCGIIHIGSISSDDYDAYAKIGVDNIAVLEPGCLSTEECSSRDNNYGDSPANLANLQSGESIYDSAPRYIRAFSGKSNNLWDIIKSNGLNRSDFSYIYIEELSARITDSFLSIDDWDLIDAIHIKQGEHLAPQEKARLYKNLEQKNFRQATFQPNIRTSDILFLRNNARITNRRSSTPVAYRIPRDFTKSASTYLLNYRKSTTSQLGEDGILSKAFEIMGVSTGIAVELAAGDGVEFSNCWTLWNNQKWNAVLIDKEPRNIDIIKSIAATNTNVMYCDARNFSLGYMCLDEMLAHLNVNYTYDLLSLDVRGNEWAVWDAHFLHRPKVVCVAFNPSFSNNEYFVQSHDDEISHGSSLLALSVLAKKKGYELISATAWNAIFVASEYFPLFGIHDNSLDAIYAEQPEFIHSFYQLYDGTVGLIGNGRHMWRQSPIDISDAFPPGLPRNSRKVAPTILTERTFGSKQKRANIYLTPTGGLVNRLMACVSSLRLADLYQRNLHIDWALTNALNAPWDALFSTPISPFNSRDKSHVRLDHRFNLDASVINATYRVSPQIDLNNATDDVSIISNCFIGHSLEDRGQQFWNYTSSSRDVGKYFSKFTPSEDVMRLTDAVLTENGDFRNVVGLHVRRGVGDNPDAMARFNTVTDENYAALVQKYAEGADRIFIATDSETSRAKLATAFGDRAIFYSTRSYAKDQSAEAIQDAFVEFLLLSRCKMLIGNRYSTFAYFASQINLVPYYEVYRSASGIQVVLHTYTDAQGNFNISEKSVTG